MSIISMNIMNMSIHTRAIMTMITAMNTTTIKTSMSQVRIFMYWETCS